MKEKEIAEKLKAIEQRMAEEKGQFDLFALFLREDSPNRWDLVVSSDWINEGKKQALQYIAKNVQETLSKDELLNLSRITIIDQHSPALEAFHKAVRVEHGMTEVKDGNFFGLQIKQAYIITSKRRREDAPKKAV